MNAVPPALIGILLSSVAVGLAQEEGTTTQSTQVVFSMKRDIVGEAKSPRRVRLEGAVDSADLDGCHDPAAIEWQPLGGFTAERAVVLRRRSPRLVRMFDLNTGASRYGLRLPSSRLGYVQGGDGDSRVTSRVMVIAGGSEQPVPGAQVLFLADQGRVEPLLCLVDTNSDGMAVLPLARRVFATVVAAEGFVGGVVAPDRSGTVRLRRSRTISGRVEAVKLWVGYDLLAAIPETKVGGEDEDVVAVAMVAPGGEFELRGVPASTSRLLLAMFRAYSLIGMSLYTVSDSPAVVAVDGASVTFTSADPDAQMELRFLRLPDGTRVRDYTLGQMARLPLQHEESRFSRERLPSGWYEIRTDGDPLGEFFLDPDEARDLGVLGAAEKFTLEVRGLEGRSGDVWWFRDLCFDGERAGTGTHTAVGPQQPVTLWIPEGCKRIWGEVRAPGMVTGRFDWRRGEPLEAVVTLRPGFSIAGTVWAPNGQPFENARLDAFEEFGLSRSREGRPPELAAVAIADKEGRFELTVGRKASFFVRAMSSSYFAPVHHVDLLAGSTPPLEIEMREGAAVSGVVRNLSGRPVEGATVHWCYLGREEIVLPSTFARVKGCKKQRPWRDRAELALWNLEGGQTIQTDAAGAFGTEQTNVPVSSLFTALPPGEIEFTVRPWAGPGESTIHTLEPGDNEVEITLRNGNTIEGEVLGLPEGSHTAEVHLATGTAPDVWTRWASKTAQAVQGAFLFENLPGGPRPYHLYATAPGYQSLERHVVLQEGDGARSISLELVPNSSVIEGSIDLYELGSEPRLTAISRTAEQRAVDVGAGGAFAFTELPVGEWQLVLNHGVPGGREEITLRRRIALAHEDARERIDIDLGSLPTLHFVGNQPGGVLWIHSTSELGYGFGQVATVSVGEDGRATIHAPRPGEYRVRYVTRPGPDGTVESYGLYQQRLEGTQTFHIGDFRSDDVEE